MNRPFMKFLIASAVLFLFTAFLTAQDSVKSIRIMRIDHPPKIDGKLDDEVWNNIPVAKDFVQFSPDNGAPARQKSEVKFLYDNTALYIGAMLFDSAPDSILTGLSERDNINNADYVGIYFDPSGMGMNGFGFFVTASGVQVDMKVDHYNEDASWDAVWQSEVSITDSGWIAEIKIPFTALRFPRTDVQNWKINVWRNIMRHRQNTNWNFVDRKKDGILSQCGNVTGVQNIIPPLRLSVMPYVSYYIQKNPEYKKWNNSINGGLDLKYGINESFTLDMTMIPDFGQVQSDDKVLNLTPYETYYGEKRPFFTEGTELFNKIGLFYSRRIGGEPYKKGDVDNEKKSKDTILSNPSLTRMINATKVSGRTKSGLGLGIFNAMTGNTFATLADSNGVERKFVTQPFTNYNLLVLDQELKNNSYINFTNTNTWMEKDGYMANVTGGDLVLRNKAKTYSIQTKGIISQKYRDTSKTDYGHAYYLQAGRIAGSFQGNLGYLVLSDKYDINDLGYIDKNNYRVTELFLRYEMTKPIWEIIYLFSYIDINHWRMYNPSVFTSNSLFFHIDGTFSNQYSFGINSTFYPNGDKDYYEPRVKGRFVIPFKKLYHFGGWINTDSRKKLSFFFNPGRRWNDDPEKYEYWFYQSVTYRATDKLSFSYALNYDYDHKTKGWVRTSDNKDTINFGIRNVRTIENIFTAKFIFNKSAYLSFRLRHYNKNAVYDKQYYELNTDGTLRNSDYSDNNNKNSNTFNIDMMYAWRFAPGSELSLVWKNIVDKEENFTTYPYLTNLKNTMNSPQTNIFSIKVIYYLDYLYLKKK
jgi:hypothetical protein